MNRRAALLAVFGLAACASVPADTEPENSNAELTDALNKAIEVMRARREKIEEQQQLIEKLRDRLTSGLNCS